MVNTEGQVTNKIKFVLGCTVGNIKIVITDNRTLNPKFCSWLFSHFQQAPRLRPKEHNSPKALAVK